MEWYDAAVDTVFPLNEKGYDAQNEGLRYPIVPSLSDDC